MRYINLSLFGLLLLALISCSDSENGVKLESTVIQQVPAAENLFNDSAFALSSQVVLDPKTEAMIADPEAQDGKAAALYRTGDGVRFQLEGIVKGTYEVSVRARGQYYEGWPTLRVSVDGNQVGQDNQVKRSSYGQGEQTFGEVTLEAGQTLQAVFTDDKYGGPDKDRNLFIDHLTLTPVGGVDPEPAAPKPDPNALPVTVGAARALNPDMFGFNSDATALGVSRDDPTYNSRLASLNPGTIRFPGGTVANYWNWEKGDFVCDKGGQYLLLNYGPTPCNLPNGYQGLNPKNQRLEHFKTELDRTGADAIFVLNLLTKPVEQTESNLDSALRMLRRARTLGIKVKYVELGNEFYLSKGTRDASDDNVLAFPAVETYITEAKKYVAAIRAEFPKAKIAVVGSDYRPNNVRRNTWNGAVAKAMYGVADAVTMHLYVGVGTAAAPSMVSAPQRRLDNLKKRELKDIPPDMPVWVTEYNMFETKVASHGSWAHGLLSASQTLTYLQDSRTELSNFHASIGNAVFGAMFLGTTGFTYDNVFPDRDNPPETRPFGLSASGQTLQLLGRAMKDMTRAQPLSFGANAPKLGGTYPALVGWSFSGRGKRAVLLNLSPGAVAVALTKVMTQGSYVQSSAEPSSLVTGNAGEVTEKTGAVAPSLTLPAYSVTLLEP